MSEQRKALRARFNRLVLKHFYSGSCTWTALAEALGISRAEVERKLDEAGVHSFAAWELEALLDKLPTLAEELGLRRVVRDGEGSVTPINPYASRR